MSSYGVGAITLLTFINFLLLHFALIQILLIFVVFIIPVTILFIVILSQFNSRLKVYRL